MIDENKTVTIKEAFAITVTLFKQQTKELENVTELLKEAQNHLLVADPKQFDLFKRITEVL